MKFTAYDKGGIMSAAKEVYRCSVQFEELLKQKEAAANRLAELEARVDEVQKEIDYFSQPVIAKTGYGPMELVVKNGRSFSFKYPNIVPEESTEPQPVVEQPIEEPNTTGEQMIEEDFPVDDEPVSKSVDDDEFDELEAVDDVEPKLFGDNLFN